MSLPSPPIRSCLCCEDHVTDGWITNATGKRQIDRLDFSRVIISTSPQFFIFLAECVVVDRPFPCFPPSRHHRALFFDMSVRRCLSICGNSSATKPPQKTRSCNARHPFQYPEEHLTSSSGLLQFQICSPTFVSWVTGQSSPTFVFCHVP